MLVRYGIALLTLSVAGCATTSGTAPTETVSGYDKARVVEVAGHGAACTKVVCPALGAQWSSKRPADAVLSVYVLNEYVGVTGARLMIDGREVVLSKLPSITLMSAPAPGLRESRQDFAASLDTIRAITEGKRVWLRVQTVQGYMDEAIIDGDRDSKAYHAMKRFLARVGPL